MVRNVDICVISDVHLGTYGCHADELFHYLKSIKPKVLILNGDFIDAWQFKKKYFPKAHLEVIHQVIRLAINGTKVYYLTGNHDDVLRKFSDIAMGPIELKDSLVLKLRGEKYWFFHGDIFDASVLISPWLAVAGGKGYDYLIRLNRVVNNIRHRLGKPKVSFSRRVKNSVKQAVKFVSDFEHLAIKHAVRQDYDYVVCGHIHRPIIRNYAGDDGKVTYMNSGDWIENLTSLELNDGTWRIFEYEKSSIRKEQGRDSGRSGPVQPSRRKAVATRNMLKFW